MGLAGYDGPFMSTHLGYSISEACAASGVRRTSLYNAIRCGQLRAVKCGSRTLILPDDLQRWLEGLRPIPIASGSAASVSVRGCGFAGRLASRLRALSRWPGARAVKTMNGDTPGAKCGE